MAVKILISGKNAPLQDYFLYSTLDCSCLSTSDVWEDITAHLDLFLPDVYLCYYTQADDELVERLRSLSVEEKYECVRLAVAGSADEMQDFDTRMPDFKGLKITLPETIVGIEKLVKEYVEKTPVEPNHKDEDSENEKMTLADVVNASDRLDSLFDELMQSVKSLETETPVSVHKNKKHILIIDDDRAILKMLKAALSDLYDVTTTITGKIAEKFLEAKNADLILLDYEMPGESGPEVLKKLRANDRSKNIPVVFLTGVADSDRIKSVLALNPRGYMLKPINIERLISTIQSIIG